MIDNFSYGFCFFFGLVSKLGFIWCNKFLLYLSFSWLFKKTITLTSILLTLSLLSYYLCGISIIECESKEEKSNSVSHLLRVQNVCGLLLQTLVVNCICFVSIRGSIHVLYFITACIVFLLYLDDVISALKK